MLKKYFQLFVVILICSAAVYLRFQNLAGRELWNDEIFQLSQTVGPFKAIWGRETYGDMTCFPGDYLITYPFAKFFGADKNKWGLAIPHFLMTLLGFYFLYRLGQRHFKTICGYVIAFGVVCLNQYLIFHSLELRPYGVLCTLALAAFYYTDILWRENKNLTVGQKYWIGGVLIGIIWFHAFGIIIVLCPLFYGLLVQRINPEFKSIFKDVLKFLLIIFLVAIPVWLWFVSANPLKFTRETYLSMGINTFTYIANPLDGFWKFFNRTVFYHLIGFKQLYFLLGILVISIFVPFTEKAMKFGFFLTVVLLPITIILSVDLVNGYWFLIRQYIYTAPLFAFFLGWLWDSAIHYYVDKNSRKFTLRSVIGLVMLIICATAGIIGLALRIFSVG